MAQKTSRSRVTPRGRSDKLKEEIGWFKVIFAIAIATDISLIAWLIQNYDEMNPLLFLGGVLGAFLIMLGIAWINRIAFKKLMNWRNYDGLACDGLERMGHPRCVGSVHRDAVLRGRNSHQEREQKVNL